MPPKKKNGSCVQQTTMSKFFTSASSSSSKKKKKTDENDDFEVVEISPKKRVIDKNDTTAEGTAPNTKKICFDNISEGIGKKLTSSNSRRATSQKLHQFELSEDCEANGEKVVFKTKNCPIISFNDSASIDDTNQINHLLTSDDEVGEIKNGGSQKTPQSTALSAYRAPSKSNPGVLVKGQKRGAGSKPVKYTPLEQQVVDIKAQRPDALLCVECGYKYRFFGEDAEIAAKVLKIYCHLDHNFMTANIPTHRLFVHLRRLVAAGYKVGVVKQMETAHLKAAGENKSGPFVRKLSALYTKSTLIGQDLDSTVQHKNVEEGGDCSLESLHTHTAVQTANQHLLCAVEHPAESTSTTQHFGIVCVDPATGSVVYDDFQDGPTFSELETRISHLRPVEIIISSSASDKLKNFVSKVASSSMTDDDKIRIEHVPDKTFADALSTLKEFYKDASSLSFVHNLPKPVTGCLSALCIYLKDFELESILGITSAFTRFSERSRYMHLSSQCLANLEVFRNSCDGSERGSLFWVLDHTRSRFGSRLLRRWLNQPLLDPKEIDRRLSAVEELLEGDNPGLQSVRELLTKLPDLERGLCTVFHQKCSPTEFCNLVKSLEKVSKSTKGQSSSVKSSLLQSLLDGIWEGLEGVSAYSASINDKAARENDLPNLFVPGLSGEAVSAVYATKEKIEDVVATINDHRKEVRLLLRQPSLTYTTVLQTEFLIEVKNTQLKTVPSDWTQISSTKTVSRFHSPFIVEKYRRLLQLREQLQKDAARAWRIFLKDFSSNFVTYKNAVTQLATLDCLMSLATVAKQDSYCKPEIDSKCVHVEIKQGRHPIIEALSNGQDQYVPNDTTLNASEGPRVLTVSGPNMGGKSSYIRQVALISILAQVGSFVPAEAASLGILDAIYTRMGASDNIFQGRSTLMVELQEAAEIMQEATQRSLVILDELGRGTSTHDGVAIAHAALKHFITEHSCLVMFVTHFPMMSEFQSMYPETVRNYHMAFLLGEDENDPLTFLYQLTEGAAARSYGLNVARLAQIPQPILELATCKSKLLEDVMAKKKNALTQFITLYNAGCEDIQKKVQEG